MKKTRGLLQPYTFFAWRSKVRVYGGSKIVGYEAFVPKVDMIEGVVTVVTHNLFRIECLELNIDDFHSMYFPDFRSTPIKMAEYLRQSALNTVMMPDALAYIEEALKKNISLEDYTVPKKAVATPKDITPVVHYDSQRRTCIEVSRTDNSVVYLPLSAGDGIVVASLSLERFDKLMHPIKDYPVDKAARLYTEFATRVGASEEAMSILSKLTVVTPGEIEMATKKQNSKPKVEVLVEEVPEKKTKTKVVKKADVEKAPSAARASKRPESKTSKLEDVGKSKNVEQKAKSGKSRAVDEKGEFTSASELFKKLIMAGKLTDDAIFAEVKARFGLDDSKRAYVNWYRKNLEKQGKNPPKAKTA